MHDINSVGHYIKTDTSFRARKAVKLLQLSVKNKTNSTGRYTPTFPGYIDLLAQSIWASRSHLLPLSSRSIT